MHLGANHQEHNPLIPLSSTDDGLQAVTGRNLHEFLEIKEPYTDWFPRMADYGFLEGQDFVQKNLIGQDKLGRRRETVDHIISLDMGKQIAMIQRTDKGRQAREYFLECERIAKAPNINGAELSRLELIQIAMNAETERLELEAKNAELEPKAEAYDTFLAADGDYSIGAVAKMLGKSQNKMFDLLRSNGIFIAKGAMRNTPYQQYMHHFSVRAHEYERQDGSRGTSYTTKVQPSGIDFIRKKLNLSIV